MSKNIYVGLACLMMSTVFLNGCSKLEPKSKTPPTIINAIDEHCVPDKFDIFQLDPHTFDQDRENGWRKIAHTKGCELSAAALINEYRTVIMAEQLSSLTWHEAQLRASAGETEQAIYLFKQTHIHKDNHLTNTLYRDATLAFLQRDKEALVTMRNALAEITEPEYFAKAIERHRKQYPDYPPPKWPPNLDVVDGFIACFDKPYKDAYKFECRSK